MAITLMYCNRLHAWWSTQSRLATLLSSLIARWRVGLQTLWWFRLKYLSIDEMVGAWCFGCLSGPPGFTCWISFAAVFFIYCWVIIFALSPCYISQCPTVTLEERSKRRNFGRITPNFGLFQWIRRHFGCFVWR